MFREFKARLLGRSALLLLVGLGILTWFLVSDLHLQAGLPAAGFPQTDVQATTAVRAFSPSTIPIQTPEEIYWPTSGWKTTTPEEQGFSSGKLAEMLLALQENKIGIDSLLIIRNGFVLLDATFQSYDGTFPHNMASVTKSITTTLVAIAAGQGKLQLDQPMLTYFPGRNIANLDDRKKSITVRQLAGMVNGMESGCLDGDEPTLDAMRSQPDWVQATLDRKTVSIPGIRFCYDSPGMHLLSAILQETTGMTELDFARQNLFEPLGIRDVFWQSDPQGYTHGWGDLFLKPKDAAKIGYLWLNNGVWDGRQIVPADWVADSVKAHTKTGQKDAYGWWVSGDSYFALGRGGQHIKVYPSLKVIVVTTGSNFEYSQIDSMLEVSFVSPDTPLPANPDGMTKLNHLISDLVREPIPQHTASVPEIVHSISGKTYLCKSNAPGVTSLRLEFNNPEIADLFLTIKGQDIVWPVGLDGKYRLSSEGQGTRGYWEDAQTFLVEVFDIGQLTRQLYFETDTVEVRLPEVGLGFKCQYQQP
jgi:CubicO group peptidase (beta-lactamase class C family)